MAVMNMKAVYKKSTADDTGLKRWIDPVWLLARFRQDIRLPRGWRLQAVCVARVFPSKPFGFGAQYELLIVGSRRIIRGHIYLSSYAKKPARCSALLRIRRNYPMVLTGLLLAVPNSSLFLHTPDRDPLMPQLREALDPIRVARHLGVSRLTKCELLSYRPARRCVLAYRTGTANAEYYVGKIYGIRKSQQVMNNYRVLHGSLGKASALLPRVVKRVVSLDMIMTQGLHVLQDHHPTVRRRATEAGRVLAVLHRATVPANKFTLKDELGVVDRWKILCERVGQLPDSVPKSKSWLEETARSLRPGKRVFLHRDFYDSQLVQSANGPALVDLDTAAAGDRELDVGNYMAHQLWRALAVGRTPAAVTRQLKDFVEAYRSHSPGQRLESGRLRFYFVSALLRVGMIHSLRSADGPAARHLLELIRRWIEADRRTSFPILRGAFT